MFDIGASEIFVIGVVALIVIGPERLPRVAKTLGHLFGRLQRYVSEVKSDINREIELDELRKLQKEMQSAAQSIEQTVKGEISSVESEFKQIGDTTQQALSDPVADPVPAADAVADAFTDSPPVQPAEQIAAQAPSVSPLAPSPQLELSLDVAALPNAPPPVILPVVVAPPKV